MNKLTQICSSYLQAHGLEGQKGAHRKPRPAIALARQWGTPLAEVEALLMKRLNPPKAEPCDVWTLFDDNLVRHVLREHHLPEVLERAMPEDRAPRADEFWREILMDEPSQWDLVQKTNDTIYRLAKRGGCVLVGRGAPWITRGLHSVIRVALTGSLEMRAERIAKEQSIDRAKALKEVERHDEAGHRYLVAHFGRKAERHELFDLILNSDHLSPELIADILHSVLLERVKKMN